MSAALRTPGEAEEPVLLKDAARLFFPHGGMTLSALRTEARKGRLAVMRIAGKDWTTAQAIRDMMSQCRVERSRPASTSAPNPAEGASGSFETDSITAEQDALRIRLQTPNSRFANTSHTKPKHRTPANVTPLRSGS